MANQSVKPEIQYFATPEDGRSRTVRALGQLGFSIEYDTNLIEGVPVETYTHQTKGRAYTAADTPPQIAAIYTDPKNGNQVSLGISINHYDLRWPFNWYGRAASGASPDAPLFDGGGNHDSNQSEMRDNLVMLLGAAHFDKPAPQLPTWTAEYQTWEAGVTEQLDPILANLSAPSEH